MVENYNRSGGGGDVESGGKGRQGGVGGFGGKKRQLSLFTSVNE